MAKKAGVSTAMVSRVINGEKYVKDKVREKVTKAAEERQYAPNYLARSLAVKKTNLIGVIVSDVSAVFFPQF